jgi:hypothetical protein
MSVLPEQDTQTRRESPYRLLFITLGVLAILGVCTPFGYNLAPAEQLIDGVFICTFVYVLIKGHRAGLQLALIPLTYLLLKAGIASIRGNTGMADFIQAYKTYFYLVALAVFAKAPKMLTTSALRRLVDVLLVTFAFKYAYCVALGITSRPGVYLENNFELILLIGAYGIVHPSLAKGRNVRFLILAAVVLLSQSRSAAACLLLLFVYVYVDRRKSAWFIGLLGGLALAGVVILVFTERMSSRDGGIASIDRVAFLQVWTRELSGWGPFNYLFGEPPLTPLSPEACYQLHFWQDLFSKSHPGVCYSVVLHSYALRVIFDQGLIGLFLLYGLVWTCFRRAAVPVRERFFILGILTASAFSVSSFNNIFATLVMVLSCVLVRGVEPGSGHKAHEFESRAGSRGWTGPRDRNRVTEGRAPVGDIHSGSPNVRVLRHALPDGAERESAGPSRPD